MFDPKSVEFDGALDTGPGLLAKTFILAQKYQMATLKNDVVDAFSFWAEKGGKIPCKVIKYTYENVKDSSPCGNDLCLFLTSSVAWTFKENLGTFTKTAQDLPFQLYATQRCFYVYMLSLMRTVQSIKKCSSSTSGEGLAVYMSTRTGKRQPSRCAPSRKSTF